MDEIWIHHARIDVVVNTFDSTLWMYNKEDKNISSSRKYRFSGMQKLFYALIILRKVKLSYITILLGCENY